MATPLSPSHSSTSRRAMAVTPAPGVGSTGIHASLVVSRPRLSVELARCRGTPRRTRGSVWEVAGGDPGGAAEPAEAARRPERLSQVRERRRALRRGGGPVPCYRLCPTWGSSERQDPAGSSPRTHGGAVEPPVADLGARSRSPRGPRQSARVTLVPGQVDAVRVQVRGG